MPSKYGITQYYSDDDTLTEAIIRVIPAFEQRPVRIRWRGLEVTINTTRGKCTSCNEQLWSEQSHSELCDRCTSQQN